LAAIKFGEMVRIDYVYNLAILNFGEFCIALPLTPRTSRAARQLDIIYYLAIDFSIAKSPN